MQVKMVLDKLYGNKKIASATHNIYAYRSVLIFFLWSDEVELCVFNY